MLAHSCRDHSHLLTEPGAQHSVLVKDRDSVLVELLALKHGRVQLMLGFLGANHQPRGRLCAIRIRTENTAGASIIVNSPYSHALWAVIAKDANAQQVTSIMLFRVSFA